MSIGLLFVVTDATQVNRLGVGKHKEPRMAALPGWENISCSLVWRESTIYVYIRASNGAPSRRHEDIVNQMARLTLGSTGGQRFVDFAVNHTTTELLRSEDWKDPSLNVPYICKSTAINEKLGDRAENFVFDFLSKKALCNLLGEPVYVISGRYLFVIENPCASAKWIIPKTYSMESKQRSKKLFSKHNLATFHINICISL